MSEYSVGFFVIPAAHCDELRKVEDEADHALATSQPDLFWRINQIFRLAHELAVAAEIRSGESEPFVDDGRDNAYIHLSIWMRRRFLDGSERHVLDVKQFSLLASRLEEIHREEFLQWSAANASKYREVATALLAELFDALQRAIRAVPPGPHGFVYTNFCHEYAEPPPEPDPGPPIAPADRDKLGQLQRFRIQARINRQRRPWWVDSPHEEARVLLGLITRSPAEELARAHDATMAMIHGGQVLLGLARLEQDVIPRIEAALIERVIETVGGPVQALCWLRGYLRWKTRETPAELLSPEQAVELDRMLDQRLDDEALTWMFGQERHWTRAVVRDTCRKLREMVKRAVAMGHGFVWYFDELRGGKDLGDDPEP